MSYADDANNIYNPQINAESTQAKSALNTTLSGITTAKADIEPYYAKAFQDLQSGEDQSHGKQAQADNLAGLLDSGLHQNQDQSITHQYANDRSNLGTEKANKIAGYDRQEQDANNSYQAALSSILDKYNGQKAAYVQDQVNKQKDRDLQTALANQAAALQRSIAAQSNANAYKIASLQASSYNQSQQQQKPTLQQELVSLFSNYKKGDKSGYTEQQIIPALQAALGLSRGDAAHDAYAYRMGTFHE